MVAAQWWLFRETVMARFLSVVAVLAFLAACGDVRYSDSEMSNIDVPRDHEGDVDEPTVE
jgi:hypothetical protein